MWVLLRTLAELVINACYLQLADESEVTRFQAFDDVAYGLFLDRFESATGLKSTAFTDTQRVLMQRVAKDAKDISGVSEKDFGWTRVNVFDRAVLIDKHAKTSAYKGLAKSVFQSGHTYTHNNFTSLNKYWRLLVAKMPVTELEREQGVDQVLFGAAHSLFLLAFFANAERSLGLEAYLDVAGALLNMPDDSVKN
jgi:hypothetical protein